LLEKPKKIGKINKKYPYSCLSNDWITPKNTGMLQLFYKTSQINVEEWQKAYQRIVSITEHFPLKLIRVEGYYGYQPNLDKDHFKLIENLDTEDECLSFYGDRMSYTTGTTIRFYKNWEKYIVNELSGSEKDPSKPITWYPHHRYFNDGSILDANGAGPKWGYIDTRGAAYEYAIIAIGIMLENFLKDRVLLIAAEQVLENIQDVVNWLNEHFQEQFELPIYFDKKRLLNSFAHEYSNKLHVVTRMEHLFRQQHKRNLSFAIENIDYQATFDCYAEILSNNSFGTFGFADVLNPWIAVTQDLESTLALLAAGKKLTLERGDEKEAAKYDLTKLLKGFLNEFILWTPQQREELDRFYTNKEALETGDESLWGMIYRMTGNRVNICPMYATQEELFEAFMYHDPKNGKTFKTIIDEWIVKNEESFDSFKAKLEETEAEKLLSNEAEDDDEISLSEKDAFIKQFPIHEQPFIELALHHNPAIINVEAGIQTMYEAVQEFFDSEEYSEHIQTVQNLSKADRIAYIKKRIKMDIKCSVHPQFETWLDEEQNENVMLRLTLLMSLKFYDRKPAFLRYCFLWDRTYWRVWGK
jgi:hypothetical protein